MDNTKTQIIVFLVLSVSIIITLLILKSKNMLDLKTNDSTPSNTTGGLPKCPTCSSYNVDKISGTNKVGSAVLLGVFSLGHISKTFKCGACGYKW